MHFLHIPIYFLIQVVRPECSAWHWPCRRCFWHLASRVLAIHEYAQRHIDSQISVGSAGVVYFPVAYKLIEPAKFIYDERVVRS